MSQESLNWHHGFQKDVWRELGLRNRFVLRRLIRKYGLTVPKREAGGPEDEAEEREPDAAT